MANRIAVIDYGMGNLRSVSKALEHVGGDVTIATTPAEVAVADRVVFPGVGAIRDCLTALDEQGLREAVAEAAASKPFLGICLGMQALMETSLEHGEHPALGILPGRVVPFPEEAMVDDAGHRLKVPHMGWNRVHFMEAEHPLWAGIGDGSQFYFVHSYIVEPAGPDLIAGATIYGIQFTSAVARENVFATQFHPEKSSGHGLQLLANFIAWDPARAKEAGQCC
ncbi:imidazole glycerol phosphate synthase [Thiohalorhabdus denitrificans]|uniref:Imidazole glycerol phosphate synthase subunit HisH n=1 Tax=Thiohalorhabdus denitrificans TaxID=381306 RepID=A0A0P9EQ28_9GAMM|nr:imidazole glycerol phosphate synthase subunit HisH [Thiohalorhabdus denitrificans]KPV40611.1 imidazole glycerol phosphate synthase [Thiohalorhabdus denitrificans]SCY49629.1 imidazole glycerol phosphate synthase subunit hisH [Thiohalorhabdus denitrificans]